MKKIFPNYPETSGSYVSQRRINKLKSKAIDIIIKNKTSIQLAFKKLASRHSKNINIHLDLNIAPVPGVYTLSGSWGGVEPWNGTLSNLIAVDVDDNPDPTFFQFYA